MSIWQIIKGIFFGDDPISKQFEKTIYDEDAQKLKTEEINDEKSNRLY
jgi:hypothetical protein